MRSYSHGATVGTFAFVVCGLADVGKHRAVQPGRLGVVARNTTQACKSPHTRHAAAHSQLP